MFNVKVLIQKYYIEPDEGVIHSSKTVMMYLRFLTKHFKVFKN